MGNLLKITNPRNSIIISALIFGIIHFNPVQVFFAFIMGLILGWLYYKTKSLWAPILIHFLNNGSAMVIMKYYPELENLKTTDLFSSNIQYVLSIIVSVVLSVLLIFLINKNFSKDNKEKELTFNSGLIEE